MPDNLNSSMSLFFFINIMNWMPEVMNVGLHKSEYAEVWR